MKKKKILMDAGRYEVTIENEKIDDPIIYKILDVLSDFKLHSIAEIRKATGLSTLYPGNPLQKRIGILRKYLGADAIKWSRIYEGSYKLNPDKCFVSYKGPSKSESIHLKISRRDWIKLIGVATIITLLVEHLLIRRDFIRPFREIVKPLGDREREFIRAMFTSDEAIIIHPGERYSHSAVPAFGLRKASEGLERALAAFDLQYEEELTMEEIEKLAHSIRDFDVASLGSPIANQLTRISMGYDEVSPWKVREPFPLIFDYSSEEFKESVKSWEELQLSGGKGENQDAPPPEWFIREVDMSKCKPGDFNEIPDMLKPGPGKVHRPVWFDSNRRESRFKTDYAILARVDNPLCENRKQIIAAGCHAEGTIAAARALHDKDVIEELRKNYKLTGNEDFEALLKVRVKIPLIDVKDPVKDDWYTIEVCEVWKL